MKIVIKWIATIIWGLLALSVFLCIFSSIIGILLFGIEYTMSIFNLAKYLPWI